MLLFGHFRDDDIWFLMDNNEEHPASCSSKKCSSSIFIWLEKNEELLNKKCKYGPQFLKYYFIHRKSYVYTIYWGFNIN